MSEENKIYDIQKPEKEIYSEYIFYHHLKNINKRFGKLLLEIFNVVALFEISDGKFYEDNGKEIYTFSISVQDIVSGLYTQKIVIKKLFKNNKAKGIYEIRLASGVYQYRIIMFPFSDDNKFIGHDFVTLSYAFDKKVVPYPNMLTDELRDSSSRIKSEFISNNQSIKEYIKIEGVE